MARDPIGEAARRLFGYEALRPGQREAIQSVLDGRDTLAVLATGSGKSAIYELAGPLRSGPTIVISPLIALQRDQLSALEAGGELAAVALNSTASARERRDVLGRLSGDGRRPDFVFLAPEQVANSEVLERLASLEPVLLAVDEAHLVSRWGPDFRPDYLRIGAAVEAIGRPVVLALTATAAPPVRDEIVQRLGMHDPAILVRGFERPNIHLGVHAYFTDERHKLDVVTNDAVGAARTNGHGIVYGATHKRVESLATGLADRGLRAAAYHAGLADGVRTDVEHRFHAGDLDVVVATIAFGMGVDKPDIRWVFHADVSGSIDEYYQEFGRAGRDGAPADAFLYFRTEDLALPRMYAARTGASESSLATLAEALGDGTAPTTLVELADRLALSRHGIETTALALADAGGLTVEAGGVVSIVGDLTEAVATASDQVKVRREIERTRVEAMEAYAEQRGCRWRYVLEYFGEPAAERCGHCDNDDRASANSDEYNGPRPFARGSRVRHRVFGDGEVIGYVGSRILLEFDNAGYKRLDMDLVLEGDLLEAADGPGS